ncbi:MAG TPA: undecaprenyl-phosphate glucose phosphotransferase [Clostridiales bacterium]|nr:undecaprenyl-phosphate glucose phosphotransferase [Clostridiales bacterium]
MIKDNQKMLNWIHVGMDAAIVALSYILAYYIRFYSPLTHMNFIKLEQDTGFYTFDVYATWLLLIIPVYLIIYYYNRLYTPKRGKLRWIEVLHIIAANTLGIILFTFALYIIKEGDISRRFLGLFYVLNIILTTTWRLIINHTLRTIRKKGLNLKHILLVGYSHATEAYIDRILANPQWGYYIHGILDDTLAKGTLYKKVPVIGACSNLDSFLEKMNLDEIVITLNIKDYENLETIVNTCEKTGVHTKFVPDYHGFIPTKPYTEDLYGLPVINIRNVPLSNTYNRFIKRIVDIFGTIVALILFGIPMIIVAVIIKSTSKGPIMFSQIRVGRHNKEFKMYKFRSMEVQDESKEKKAWTTISDPRVTPIGKFIRRTSIDELPQLFNVLKGDMSLVGPRPERPFFVEKFKEEIPRYMIKHQVSPGLTGWAQINGFRGDTSIRKRIDHDLYYIENWTIGLDFKIIFLTFFKGFINKNAY